MITSKTPNTWNDVQKDVGSILSECGMSIDIERTIDIARGKVEVDVSAEEEIRGRTYKIFVECKNWKSAVPQTVVHSFRTVVQDAGAHRGYIVSAAGFQAGSYEAVTNTNVELVTWEEFQTAFEATWMAVWFSPELTKELDPLMSHVEPLFPSWFGELPEADQNEYVELKQRSEPFGWLIMSLSVYGASKWPALPIRPHVDAAAASRIGSKPMSSDPNSISSAKLRSLAAVRDATSRGDKPPLVSISI